MTGTIFHQIFSVSPLLHNEWGATIVDENQCDLKEVIARLMDVVENPKSVELLNFLLLEILSEEPPEES